MDAKSMYGNPPKKKTKGPGTEPAESVEFTQRHSGVKKKMESAIDKEKANTIAFISNKGAGTKTAVATKETTPEPFKRTEKRGGTHTEFYGTDGKVTYRGLNDSKGVSDYRSKSARDEKETNSRRARNANDANLFMDVKKNLTQKDKEQLRSIKHIK